MTNPDFIQIPNIVFSNKTLQANDKFLFGFIYWYTKMKLEMCVAGNETLAAHIGTTPASISNSLARLEKAGFITRSYKNANKEGRVINCSVEYGVTSNVQMNASNVQVERVSLVDETNIEDKNKNIQKTSAKANEDLFYELVEQLGFTRGRVKFLPGRQSKLAARLKNADAVALRRAAVALSRSPFHMGQNENNRKYGDIDFLLRNDEMIEKWSNHLSVSETFNGVAKV